MNIQKSYAELSGKSGKLYLVATPVGNLEDMTYRAVRILKEVDFIAAEDTRQTRKLLNHFEIKNRLFSYHEHNKMQSGPELVARIKAGENGALVSDAGMPAISDPGYELVAAAIHEEIDVIPIPGANAALTALVASGLETTSFTFIGFLPRDRKKMEAVLTELKNRPETLLFYESPHRLEKTLKQMSDVFGKERHVVIARELTKRFEEFLRGSLEECTTYVSTNSIAGEFCILIEGNKEPEEAEQDQNWWHLISVEEHFQHYLSEGLDRKEAMKMVAQDRGVSKRDIYSILNNTP